MGLTHALVLLAVVANPNVDKRLDVGPLTLRVQTAKPVVGLADAAVVSITATSLPNVVVEDPVLPDGGPDFRLLSSTPQGPDPVNRFVLRRWDFRIEPLRLGKLRLPAAVIRYREGETAEWSSGVIPLPELEVVPATEAGADPSSLKPVPSILQPPPRDRRWWLVSAGVLLLGLGVVLAFRRPKPSNSQVLIDPAEKLRGELAKLNAGPSADARAEIDRLRSALREYLENRHGLTVLRQTTSEFLADDQTRAKLSDSQRELLARLLETADVESFAGRQPMPEDVSACRQSAFRFLETEEEK